jgi:two-component system, NarL family, sensor histidine kinase DesK
MAVTLVPRPGLVQDRRTTLAGFRVVVRLPVSELIGSLTRQPAVWAATGYAAVFPIVQVALLAESADGGGGRAAWALAATVCFLPLHCRHVYFAACGERPPAGRWTLAAMAAIISGVLPLAGPSWLPMFHALIVSVLIVLPFRLSFPIVAVIIAAQAPLALALHSDMPAAASYYVLTATWRSASVFVPIWLVGAITQLNAARARLARDAVVRERLNIDAELRSTVGAALTSIANRGRHAVDLIDRDAESVPGELQALVSSSRTASADARRLIGRYHHSAVRAELDTAVTLLAAAGIEVRLSLPPELPESSDAAFRAALRTMTTRLLRDDAGGPIVLAVSRNGDAVRLEQLPASDSWVSR